MPQTQTEPTPEVVYKPKPTYHNPKTQRPTIRKPQTTTYKPRLTTTKKPQTTRRTTPTTPQIQYTNEKTPYPRRTSQRLRPTTEGPLKYVTQTEISAKKDKPLIKTTYYDDEESFGINKPHFSLKPTSSSIPPTEYFDEDNTPTFPSQHKDVPKRIEIVNKEIKNENRLPPIERPNRLPMRKQPTRNKIPPLRYTRRPTKPAEVSKTTTTIRPKLKEYVPKESKEKYVKEEVIKKPQFSLLGTKPPRIVKIEPAPTTTTESAVEYSPKIVYSFNEDSVKDKDKFVPSKEFYFPSFTDIPTQPPINPITQRVTTVRPLPPSPHQFIYDTPENHHPEVLPPVVNTPPHPYPNIPALEQSELQHISNSQDFNNNLSKDRHHILSKVQTQPWPNTKPIDNSDVHKKWPPINAPFKLQPPPLTQLKNRPGPPKLQLKHDLTNSQFIGRNPPNKRTRTRPPPFHMNRRRNPNENRVVNIDSGFNLPREAENLPPRNPFDSNRPPQNSPKQRILPQFRPNAGEPETTVGFKQPPIPKPLRNPNRRTKVPKNRPSFFDNFNFFRRTPVNRRRGETGSLVNTNTLQSKSKPKPSKKEADSEYLISHGPVPVQTQKVIVIGPFDRPPPGAPMILPEEKRVKSIQKPTIKKTISSAKPIGLFPPPPPPLFNTPLKTKVITAPKQQFSQVVNANMQIKTEPTRHSNTPLSSRRITVSNNDESKNNQITEPTLNNVNQNLSPVAQPYRGTPYVDQSMIKEQKTAYTKSEVKSSWPGRSSAVIYGRPVKQPNVINGNVGVAEVSTTLNVSKPPANNDKFNMNGPTLIDNVKQEDKDAIVAAQFYFPNLNTVQRSGQQRVIPLPIPVLTKNAPKKFYNKRPFAADRHIVVEGNFDGQSLSVPQPKYKTKYKSKPTNLSPFMLPPPPSYQKQPVHSSQKQPQVSHSLNIKSPLNKPVLPKMKDQFVVKTKFEYQNDSPKMVNNATDDVSDNTKEIPQKSDKVAPKQEVSIVTTGRPVYNNYRHSFKNRQALTTRNPSKPMRVTEFDPNANRTPIPTLKPNPKSFVEPSVPEHSYDGWVVIGSSLPDSVNPVVSYVKENTPKIKIKNSKEKTSTSDNHQNQSQVKYSKYHATQKEETPKGEIITGTPIKENVKDGSLVQYSTLLSIEAPDVVNSYLIPYSEQYQ